MLCYVITCNVLYCTSTYNIILKTRRFIVELNKFNISTKAPKVPLRRKIHSKYYNISLGVVCSLLWGHCDLAGRRLPRIQEIAGLNTNAGKIWFSHFTRFRVECKELFCKTNKNKTIKINKILILTNLTTFNWNINLVQSKKIIKYRRIKDDLLKYMKKIMQKLWS